MASPVVPQTSRGGTTSLFPVLPLPELCLFPEASWTLVLGRPAVLRTLEIAARTGRRLVALAQKDAESRNPRDLYSVGTLAELTEDRGLSDGSRRVELDGLCRARVLNLLGADVFVAEVEPMDDGDAGEEWGAAVEALARYLHAHAELRSFLDQQRRSKEPMAWVNLACQHLPITATARQKLLEAGAAERCLKIGRGLDALLRKEKGD
jgi:ATP-dependent Lon protease